MRKYRLVAKKGEGTFSEVLKAQNVKDGKYHAIKCMKNRFESVDQVRHSTIHLYDFLFSFRALSDLFIVLCLIFLSSRSFPASL